MDISQIKTLPSNRQAEMSLLCCLINNEDLIREVKVKPEMFFDRDCKNLFLAIMDCYQEKQTLDYSLLVEKWVEPAFYIDVTGMVVGSAHFTSYQDILIERHNKRLIIKNLQKGIAWAHSDTPVDTIIQLLHDTIQSVETPSSETDFWDTISTVLWELGTNASYIASYGLSKIDNILTGYKIGQLNIIGARPGIGKTSVLLTLAHEIIKQNKKCLVLSLEMTAKELASRLVSKISKKSVWGLSRLTQAESTAVALDVAEKIGAIENLFVYDNVFDISSIISTIRRAKYKHGADVVFIDYLGLITSTQWANRNLEIQYITRSLKQLAKELELAIVCLSQLNRNVEQANRRPMLSDLRDSWAIEQDADVVILLHRDVNDSPLVMEFEVAKHRNWIIGTIELWFDAPTMTLQNNFITNP